MKLRFAVVDDAAFLRELIKNIVISAGGLCVGEASNGEEAMDLVGATLPDLVFLDMVMPLKNGIDTAAAIKELYPDVKVIGCSTIDNVEMINKAFAAGFDDYITKPFTKEEVLDKIARVLPQLGESNHGRT